jgi:hypothetical protein
MLHYVELDGIAGVQSEAQAGARAYDFGCCSSGAGHIVNIGPNTNASSSLTDWLMRVCCVEIASTTWGGGNSKVPTPPIHREIKR